MTFMISFNRPQQQCRPNERDRKHDWIASLSLLTNRRHEIQVGTQSIYHKHHLLLLSA